MSIHLNEPLELRTARGGPAVEPAEIDVEEVLREFTAGRVPRDGVDSDPEIRAIDPADRALVRVPPCPVCDAVLAEPTYEIRGLRFRLVTCAGCGTGSLNPRPTAEEIRRFYPPEYYGGPGAKFRAGTEWLVRCVAQRHAAAVARDVPFGGRVLDVGCGRGVLLNALTERGFEPHGTEISREAAAGVDRRAQVRIAPRLADADYPDGHFDAVVLSHVLEHLPDPRETLDEVHRILGPGGRLIVAVPNLDSLQARWAGPAWFHLDLPRHLYHFPLPALRMLLRSCRFRDGRVRHFSLRQNPFGWVQSALNRRGSWPRNALYHVLRRDCAGAAGPLTSRRARLALRLAYAAGMPVGVLASLVEALCARGAAVEVTACKV